MSKKSAKKVKTKKSKSKIPILVHGDIVDIVAPSSRCAVEILQKAQDYIKSLGLVPRMADDIFGDDFLFSNTDSYRLKSLSKAIQAKDSKAIWCLRGGYGSSRLLPGLKKLKRPAKQKLFIGYSDMTALHGFFGDQWKWSTIHGPMLERLSQKGITDIERRDLEIATFAKDDHFEYLDLVPMNAGAKKNSTIKGEITGGNLHVLVSLIGTPFAIKTKGKILFLEDIGERGYRVDRLLFTMKLSGYLQNVKAIVFGTFTECDESTGEKVWYRVLERFAAENRIPVLTGLPVGHGDFQRCLPLHATAKLKLGSSPSLIVARG